MNLKLIVSDKNLDILKIKQGMTITKVIRDYSKEDGNCVMTITTTEPPSELDFLKADLKAVEKLYDEVKQNQNVFGILKFACRKVEIQRKIQELKK